MIKLTNKILKELQKFTSASIIKKTNDTFMIPKGQTSNIFSNSFFKYKFDI
jgi:hypothetical protein